MAYVLKAVADRRVDDVLANGRALGLLDVDNDVVLQGVTVALQEGAVRRQPGRSYLAVCRTPVRRDDQQGELWL